MVICKCDYIRLHAYSNSTALYIKNTGADLMYKHTSKSSKPTSKYIKCTWKAYTCKCDILRLLECDVFRCNIKIMINIY